MKKHVLLWICATLSSLIILAMVITTVFRGDRRDVIMALPKPGDGSTYVLFSGNGEVVPRAFVDGLMSVGPLSSCRSVGIIPMLRLIPRSVRAAVLVEISDGKVDLYGAFSFQRGILGSLRDGSIPGFFSSVFNHPDMTTVCVDGFPCLQLSGRFMDRPLYVDVDGGISLFASSPSGLKSMKESLLMMKESPPSRWGVEPYWDAHLRVNLMPGQTLAGWGLGGSDRLEFQGALKSRGFCKGSLAWRIDGIDERKVLASTRRWLPLPDLLRPLGSVVAVADMGFLKSVTPFPWSGPGILACGGLASVMSVPFPGFLFAMLETDGTDMWKSLWNGSLSDFSLGPVSSDKYPEGGFSSHPVSIVFAGGADVSLVGVVDRKYLYPPSSFDLEGVLPDGWEESFSWGYINGPHLAQGLEGMVKAGRLIFPDREGEAPFVSGMDELVSLTRQMRKIGEWSFVIPKINEGILYWN